MIILTDKHGSIIPTETVTEFKVGDELLHLNNYAAGLKEFFVANQEDVDNFSDKNGIYIKKLHEEI